MDRVSLPWIESHPVVRVEIGSLVLEDSPRQGGEDQQHIRLLAEAESLPPITVHRATMRVIDGNHRVRAALLNGHTVIDARLLDCDADAAFVLAVKANVTHGLPLSRADRTAAAARIITTHPQWSDRAVATATALSDKTISRIRAQCVPEAAPPPARVGRDGRVRPLDSGRRREQAAAALRRHPHAGLREIARATGLSPATVRDVRQRIGRGEHPIPDRYRNAPPEPAHPPAPVDHHALLAQLGNDPAMRHSEAGRHALRLLHRCLVNQDHLSRLRHGLPDHWAPHIATLARDCATAWQEFAQQLQERAD